MRKLKLTELNRATLEDYQKMTKSDIVVVLDNLRSAGNVGSFFRTSDALAVKKIILCGITSVPPNKEITKTAIGATESVSWKYNESVLDAVTNLKKLGYQIAGIEQTDNSVSLEKFEPTIPIALVFGNEVNGLSEEILSSLDVAVEIPQYGTKHSFNVAVCGGIVLWEVFQKTR
jgi:tRNA G18 (ribose-2'-O)-methylase SpoU